MTGIVTPGSDVVATATTNGSNAGFPVVVTNEEGEEDGIYI